MESPRFRTNARFEASHSELPELGQRKSALTEGSVEFANLLQSVGTFCCPAAIEEGCTLQRRSAAADP
jgi:hypothetical protein